MLSWCRLATCATAEFGRTSTTPQCLSSRSPPTPPPRCARHRPSPPREVGYTRLRHPKSDLSRINPPSIGREGGSPRCRRSEQEPPYAIALLRRQGWRPV